jgi:hypothetical protein
VASSGDTIEHQLTGKRLKFLLPSADSGGKSFGAEGPTCQFMAG